MRLFVSIVSHRHHSILINLGTMRILAEHPDIVVVCRDNIPTRPLQLACEKYGVHYVSNENEMGFAANNNANFELCRHELGMREDDYFVVLNPDLYMESCAVAKMVQSVVDLNHSFYVPNLLLDIEELMLDDNIRTYPTFTNFIQTYLFNRRVTMVERRNGLDAKQTYWASGAFLIVKSSLYQSVRGLDEKYYMYCEDLDFCARLKMQNIHFHYLADVKATHLRRRDSKRFLSKYFWWHVSSVIRHSFTRKSIEARKSCIAAVVKKSEQELVDIHTAA